MLGRGGFALVLLLNALKGALAAFGTSGGGSTEAGNSWGTRNTPATACAAMAFCIIVFLHGSRFQRFPAPRGTA
jgi:hypothetical protein